MNVGVRFEKTGNPTLGVEGRAFVEEIDPNERIDRIMEFLVSHEQLDEWLEAHPAWVADSLRGMERSLEEAFDGRVAEALHACHTALKRIYDMHLLYDNPAAINQHNAHLAKVRALIEKRWMDAELRRSAVVHVAVPDEERAFAAHFREWVVAQRAANHPLYHYLERHASRERIIDFFLSDYLLNVRFFDIIVMSALGTSGGIRQEVSQNLWDESGGGVARNAHTTLFRRLIERLGIGASKEDFLDRLQWQGLAGYNLFMLLGIHRKNYYLSVGSLAATEVLDPPQYTRLMTGCRRVGLDRETELDYYTEHITVDILHGDAWIDKVMLPLLRHKSTAAREFMLGAEMRLNTCCDYLDALLADLVRREDVK